MAKRKVVQYFDDITGEPVDEPCTVQFGIDGRTFEIDLSGSGRDALRDVLAPYIASARRLPRSRRR